MSGGLSAGLHYTWSKYLDTASEIFNPSSGEVAVAQDSFDIAATRAVSSYDRPHRFTGNFVWELPFMRDQQGVVGKILGGWQFSSFFTLQSGAPFTPLNGSDPTGALAGIDGLVGNSIRPNINTDLDLVGHDDPGAHRGGRRQPVPDAVRHPERDLRRRARRQRRRATRCAPTASATSISGSPRTRGSPNGQNIQLRIEMFNATNTRNFGIPDGRVNSANFLNQWATDGGNRRVWVAVRYVF